MDLAPNATPTGKPMPWLVTLGLILAVWLVPTSPAQAGTISLSTTVAASVAGQNLRVEVSLLNQGDEAARDLALSLSAAGKQIQAPGPTSLPPHQPWRTVLELPLLLTLPGSYPALVTVRFHDLNGYAFSSLAHALFDLGSSAPSGVSAQGFPGRVIGDGKLRFELTNADQAPHAVSLRAIAPEELSLEQPPPRLKLAPGGGRGLDLTARNLAALAGSSYPVLLLLEYDHDGRHHSVVAVAPVTVEAPPDLVREAVPFLYALAGLLLAVMIGLQMRASRAPGSIS